MNPPRTVHSTALYLRVMLAAAFDGVKVGEVRNGTNLPSSPWPRREQCGQCGAEVLGYHACLGVPDGIG